jgi:hypothetical protein
MVEGNTPASVNSLTNGVNILIEVIRRYCSEIEQVEFQQHQVEMHKQQNSGGRPISVMEPSVYKIHALSIDLSDLLKVFRDNIVHFSKLLTHPRSEVTFFLIYM